MAFINPDKFVVGGLPDILWSYLELGIVIIFIIFGLYYLRLFVKTRADNKIQAHFNLAYTLFFLILSVNQLFYLADADVMFTELGPFLSAPVQIVLVVIGIGIYEPAFQIVYMFLLFLLPFLFIMFPTEKYLLNRKKCPISIIMAITIILVSAMLVIAHSVPDVTGAGDALYNTLVILHPAVVLCVLLSFVIGLIGGVWIYVMLGIKTTGTLRKKSFATAFGFIVWFLSVVVGNLLKGELSKLSPFAILLGPILFYAGTFLLMYSFMRK